MTTPKQRQQWAYLGTHPADNCVELAGKLAELIADEKGVPTRGIRPIAIRIALEEAIERRQKPRKAGGK